MNKAVAQKVDPEVEQVLASIRQIMSEEVNLDIAKKPNDVIRFPQTHSLREKKSSGKIEVDVLDLTEMIANDGTVISLKKRGARMAAAQDKQTGDTLNAAESAAQPENTQQASVLDSVSSEAPTMGGDRNDTMELSEAQQIQDEVTPKIDGTHEEIESIMSADAVIQSTAAFNDLNKLNDYMQSKIQDGTFGTQTLDQLMRELLRPLLKEWLDSHLPSLVKWLVAEKIEQMIRERQEKA